MKMLLVFLLLVSIITGSIYLYFKNIPSHIPPTTAPTSVCEAIHIVTPQQGTIISSPLQVEVMVDNTQKGCHWTVFEAQAGTIEIKDEKGTVIGNGTLITTEDWQKDSPTHYSGKIIFSSPPNTKLDLVISEENPNGKPHAQVITLPLLAK